MKLVLIVCLLFLDNTGEASQLTVDAIANNVDLVFHVVTNFASPIECYIDLTNEGDEDITDTDWEIYFTTVSMFEDNILRPNPGAKVALGDTGLLLSHIEGTLMMIEATDEFPGFESGTPFRVPITRNNPLISRTDVYPNWYVTAEDAEPKVIQSTAGEALAFVDDLSTPQQYKRAPADTYEPYSSEYRYNLYEDTPLSEPQSVVPNPHEIEFAEDYIEIDDTWVIVSESEETMGVAEYLSAKLNLPVVDTQPDENSILLEIGDVFLDDGEQVTTAEAYNLFAANDDEITIRGIDGAGVFFGAQTFLSLFDEDTGVIREVVIADFPRYPYRGMHIDVGRNFFPKDDILKVLDVMGMYKLNKFHFHLIEDEGWRLEIPGLPELTEVGGFRCHDLTGSECVIPQLGSGPFTNSSGSGYYTVNEYREILQYAADRFIQVIPEFDSPGHGHAAIIAMEERYRRLVDTDPEAAEEYLLTDLEDESEYISIQNFRHNAINPCVESTYTFFTTIIQEVKAMHEDIQPLTVFNFGGDEVPPGAWAASPACEPFDMQPHEIKQMFVERVAVIANEEGLDLAAWEDGVMGPGYIPYDRSLLPNDQVNAYAWDNVWEWGGGSKSYRLANADYNVVIAHSTDLYYDMPYEPDPEERGLYWATRLATTRDSFNYMPDRVYDNMNVDGYGRPLDKDAICNQFGCEELEEGKEDKIIGMQGQLWSETVRTSEQMFGMVFPRIIAIAERAWNKAAWEDMEDDDDRIQARNENWVEFANALGQRELLRLDEAGITYNIPLPGGRITDESVLEANSNCPGLPIEYSTDDGESWQLYDPEDAEVESDVLLRTRSADGNRNSRSVNVPAPFAK